jgi:uncharacterized protein YkwD
MLHASWTLTRLPPLTATALVALLSACGGGGGGSAPVMAPAMQPVVMPPVVPGPPPPAGSPTSSLVTSVAAPTYSTTLEAEERDAFHQLNNERGRCGFGLLAQSAALDTSAKGHARWQLLNNVIGHFQVAGTPGFTGVGPLERALAAGYVAPGDAVSVYDDIVTISGTRVKTGFGVAGVQGLLNAPYHAFSLLSTAREIGISVRNDTDVASTQGARVLAQFALGNKQPPGPQVLGVGDVQTYPCQGSTGVDRQLENESPNPVPGRDLASSPLGTSVMIVVRQGQTLQITQASMVNQATQAAVTLRPATTAANDPNQHLGAHQVFISADAPLLPNTAYQVTLNGRNNGVAFSRLLTFTTGS